MKKIYAALIIIFAGFSANSQPAQFSNYRWTFIEAEGDVTGRHENTFIEYKDKFYLIGGRGVNPVNIFDPATNTWETKGKTPMEIHHFQAVVYGDAIYVVGGMTKGYPRELPLENIWIYYPETDTWKKGDEIPEARRRGCAGTVVYNHKIYWAGGIKYGHTSGTTNYFDSYDLKTGKWETLTDAPHIRDHFHAIVADDKLYCIGGRNTSVHYPDHFAAFFDAVIPEINYYDFNEEQWYTLREPLPVPTAAGGIVKIDNYLVYMGGEGPRNTAYVETQCFDLNTREWTQLANMHTGRHGTAAILYNNKIYKAAGSPNRGGGNLPTIEVFSMDHNWEPLFNGENLDGWQVKAQAQDRDKNFWTVENGNILANSMGTTDHGYIWLQSEKEYGDFELRLKFKVSRESTGNSGVQIRSRYHDKDVVEGGKPGWLDGPQVDIDPHNPWRNGLIYDETRTEKRWIYPSLTDWRINKETHAPSRGIFYWEDQLPGWNDMIIIAKRTSIKTFVNNIPIADFDGSGILDSEGHKKYNVGMNGHIALQIHKNCEIKIWLKDIEVRELK